MSAIWNISAYFAAARAVHFASCLLLLSVCVFDRFIVSKVIDQDWNRIGKWMIAMALPIALLSGIGWFAAVAVQMSGRPLSIDVMRIVWSRTQFGTLWQLRLILWIGLLIFFCVRWRWMSLICSGVFVLTLAWSGHGRTGSSPRVHLIADVLHLLAASAWPTSLLPLSLMLVRMRKRSSESVGPMVRRFSSISVFAVALLLISGIANSCFLLDRVSDLFITTYGRVLLLKIILFVLTVAIGAVNLLILGPRLPASASRLHRNVSIELCMAVAVLIVVAILGLLPPAQ